MILLKLIPFLEPLIDKITQKDLVEYLKEENRKKDDLVSKKENEIAKLYRRVKKAEKL